MDSNSSSDSAALEHLHSRNSSAIRLHDDSSRQHLNSSDGAETSLTGSGSSSYDPQLPPYSGVATLSSAASSKQSLATSSPIAHHRADPPAPLELPPKAYRNETVSNNNNDSLDTAFAARSRSETIQTESSFGSPTTARSAYFDAASSVEGDARSVASVPSREGTPDYAGSAGSRTPRLGHAELGESPLRPPPTDPVTPPRKLRRNRESVASTASDHSSIAYPPNHGVVGIDLFETAARGNGLDSPPHGPGQWYGTDPYAYHSGSTVHLPHGTGLSPPRFVPASRSRSGTPRGGGRSDSPGRNERNGAHVLQIRHSNSFERARSGPERYSLDGSDKDGSEQGDDDLVVHDGRGLGRHGSHSFDDPYGSRGHHSGTTPRIVVAGEDDDSLHEWDGAEATNSHGGDQTGVILG